MNCIKKIFKSLLICIVVSLLMPVGFVYATSAGGRELTDRENAAFIVRDEWTAWVRGFTASLSELDKNATSRIYDNMDFYDMQYRFTEKYKKVPEYLDEDGKPTQKLKDLIKDKRKKITGAAGVKDYLKITAIENGTTVHYAGNGVASLNIDIGYSKDGLTFIKWQPNTPISLNAGESIYIWNKTNTLSTGEANYVSIRPNKNCNISGNINSLLNFEDVKPYCFFLLFPTHIVDASELQLPSTTLAESCYFAMFESNNNLVSAPELPATTLAPKCYWRMFDECYNLKNPPSVLPAKTLQEQCYRQMFADTDIEKAPEIQATTLAENCFQMMFNHCTELKYIKIAYTGNFEETYFEDWIGTDWSHGSFSNTGDFYYNGEDMTYGQSAIPKDDTNRWNVHNFTSPLKFTAGALSTLKYRVTGTPDIEMQYSYDNVDWVDWPANTDITLTSGQGVYVKNNKDTLSTGPSNFVNFVMSGRIAASGDINALINYRNVSNYCYYQLFDGCTALTSVPDLPSKTIAEYCYNLMFNGCTSITDGATLPATSLPGHCYERMFQGCNNLLGGVTIGANSTVADRSCYYMFNGCSALTVAPELNALTLAPGCYMNMFTGCISLQAMPELPATTLAHSCYASMFSACINLEYATIDLPATTLAESCYAAMFSGCSRLKKSPIIKATTLANNCFSNMFASCTNLNSIDIMFYTGSFDSTYFTNWTSGVSNAGTLYYAGTDTSNYSTSAIPKDSSNMWLIKQRTPLAFTAEQDNSTVKYAVSTTYIYVPPRLYYSYDNLTWTRWNVDTDITLNAGEKVYIKSKDRKFSESPDRYNYFVMSGRIAASGSLDSLISYSELSNYCFYKIFMNCSALTSPPELPTTTLAPYCYHSMFSYCSSLQTAPELPATTLAESCYNGMFYNCTSLHTATDLPATVMAEDCYKYMFGNTAIQTGPDIKATTLATNCFQLMFFRCTSLNSIKIAYTGDFDAAAFSGWVSYVSNTGTLYYSGPDTSNFGNSAIPKDASNHWNVQPY